MSKSFFVCRFRSLCLPFVFAILGASGLAAGEPDNILFFGNSFTIGVGSSQSVPALVQSVAVAAGHPMPNVVSAAVSGKDFTWHLENNLAVIGTSLPATEQWDFVVMQNFSTAPTRLGDVNQHRSDTVSLYQEVANHSPQVTPVLFETWARAPGHEFYSLPDLVYSGGASQMQQEVRDGYRLAKMDIDVAAGPGTARVAPIGDAWESMAWMIGPRRLHDFDLWHATNPGTLLAALTIYATIYEDDTADIDLSGVLAGLHLPGSYGSLLSTAADQTVFGVPEPPTLTLLVFTIATLMVFGQRTSVCCCVSQKQCLT